MGLGCARGGTDLAVCIVSRFLYFHHVWVEDLTLLYGLLESACYRASLKFRCIYSTLVLPTEFSFRRRT